MTIDQIIEAERQARRAFSAVSAFVETGSVRDALARAEQVLAEARHFAVCWEDNRKLEDEDKLHPTEARRMREVIIDRLVTNLVPTRL